MRWRRFNSPYHDFARCLFGSWYIIMKKISNPIAHNPKRVAQENPFKFVDRPCQFFHESFMNLSWKLRSNNLYWVYEIYALISYIITNQAIEFQPFCTQSQMCSIGKSIQMRGTSLSIWRNLSWKLRSNNLYWVHEIFAPISYIITNQAIDFQPCCTQSQTCSTGKSIQMRVASASIWKNLSRKIRRNKFIFYTSKLCTYSVRDI